MAVAAVLSVSCSALSAKVPAQTRPKAVDEARDPAGRLLARRRARVADVQDRRPAIKVVTKIGTAVLTMAAPVLTGRPQAVCGVLGIVAPGGLCGYGARLVRRRDHPYAYDCAHARASDSAAAHAAPATPSGPGSPGTHSSSAPTAPTSPTG
ncbi:hypothetical protein ACIA8F_29280 [Streptomyces sp. NPDC051563]|uniref:hypothetical protein n=1 Tax=Streptomyces sp. NPDC051563 TaxID=3365659 RepID=UPI0037921445